MTNEALGISESRLSMWRAVVCIIHADGVVTPHEMAFIQSAIKDVGLSDTQMKIIGEDLQTPQDAYEMFSQVTSPKDKNDYFALARAVSWCDGDLDKQERLIIKNLEKMHMNEEEMAMLNQSRQQVHEIELCHNQWNTSPDEGRKKIFSVFSKFKSDPVTA